MTGINRVEPILENLMYEQQEYGLAYGLVFGLLLLGMLLVCVPRPRKAGFIDPKQAAKEKKLKQRQKTQARSQKKSAKNKKKKLAQLKKKKG